MNHCNFVGKLTEDIKFSTVLCSSGTLKDKAIIKLILKRLDEQPVLIELIAWDKQAQFAAKNLKKGETAIIEATVKNEEVYDINKQDNYQYQFIAKKISKLELPKLPKRFGC